MGIFIFPSLFLRYPSFPLTHIIDLYPFTLFIKQARPEARTIDLLISDEEWEARRKAWSPPPLRSSQGTLFKYIQNVATASEGCVTDEVGTRSASEISAAAPKTPAVAELEAKIKELEEKLGVSV